MKIVLLCDFFNEALEFQENLMLKYYCKHGHQVTVVTSLYDSVFEYYNNTPIKCRQSRQYYYKDCKIVKLPYAFNLLGKIRPLISISNILSEEQPDLIFVHNIMPNLLQAKRYIASHHHCKMAMAYHGDFSNSAKNWLSLRILHGLVRKSILRRILTHLEKVFPVVPGAQIFLNQIYDVPNKKMEVLPLGADCDLIDNLKVRTNDLESLRKQYAFNKDHLVIVTGGKLEPRKKTHLVLDIFLSLVHQGYKLKLIIIGESSKADSVYQNQLMSCGSQHPDVTFTGWLSTREIYQHFLISDIAFFPASQSIMWQQAIACGLPLVVGNTGHQSVRYLNIYNNIIIHNAEAISHDAFKKTLEKLILNKQERMKMHQGALQVSDECLNWNRLIHRTLQFNHDDLQPEKSCVQSIL